MSFDLASSKPLGFDLSTAKSVETVESFDSVSWTAETVEGFRRAGEAIEAQNHPEEVPTYSSEIVPESVTPLGGGTAGRQLASYFGFGPRAEIKRVNLPDGQEVKLTRGDETALAFDLNTNDIKRWDMSLEALMPRGGYVDADGKFLGETATEDLGLVNISGGKLVSARERWGDDFMNASYSERMEIQKQQRAAGIQEDHGLTFAAQQEVGEDATATMVGSLAKEFATPTVLAPLGKGLKATAAISGLVGGQMEASRQAVGDKEFDPLAIAKDAAIGSVFGLGLTAPIRTVQAATKAVYEPAKKVVQLANKKTEALTNKVLKKKALKGGSAGSTKAANNLIIKIEKKFDEKIASGVPRKDVEAQAIQELGLTPEELIDTLATSTRTLKVPTKKQAAINLQLRSNPLASQTLIGKQFDFLAAPITGVIKKISEPVFARLRKFEMDSSINVAQSQSVVLPYLKAVKNIRKRETDPEKLAALSELERNLMSGHSLAAGRIAKQYFPDLEKQLFALDGKKPVISGLLDDIHARARDAGIKVGYLASYWPRQVKDLEGLKQAFGSDLKTPIDKALVRRAKKEGVEVKDLDEDTVAEVMNSVYQGRNVPRGSKRVESERVVSEITPELQEFYHDSATSLSMYVERMEREIAKRNFFRNADSLAVNSKGATDVEQSIGNLVSKLRKDNTINSVDEENLRMLLTARFEMGEQSMGKQLAKARDLQTMSLLAQFDSAAIQLGDIGSSVYVNGLSNTIKALATGSKKARVTPEELGLLNRVSAEFNNTNGFTDALNKTMKWSAFASIDRLGKRVFIEAAISKASKLAKTDPSKLQRKYGKVFGDEMDSLIGDLQRGDMTENVKLYLWNELSDVQPISLSEMPRGYLENPNGRIFYALKSFGLKQLDLIRKDIVDLARAGHKKEALENATRYALVMGTLGATVEETRQFIRGGFDTEAMSTDVSSVPSAIETFPDAAFESLMKIAFLGKYQRERYLENGQIGEYIAGTIMPASLGLADVLGAAALSPFADEWKPEKLEKAVKGLPVLGHVYYYMLGGGAEKVVEKEQGRKRKELRDRKLRQAL